VARLSLDSLSYTICSPELSPLFEAYTYARDNGLYDDPSISEISEVMDEMETQMRAFKTFHPTEDPSKFKYITSNAPEYYTLADKMSSLTISDEQEPYLKPLENVHLVLNSAPSSRNSQQVDMPETEEDYVEHIQAPMVQDQDTQEVPIVPPLNNVDGMLQEPCIKMLTVMMKRVPRKPTSLLIIHTIYRLQEKIIYTSYPAYIDQVNKIFHQFQNWKPLLHQAEERAKGSLNQVITLRQVPNPRRCNQTQTPLVQEIIPPPKSQVLHDHTKVAPLLLYNLELEVRKIKALRQVVHFAYHPNTLFFQ
jgi:hypothetical protein